jgi:hypothetical protein
MLYGSERGIATMHSFGVFGPEAMAELSGRCLLKNSKTPVSVTWCANASPLIAAARAGERDTTRLLEAALRKPD